MIIIMHAFNMLIIKSESEVTEVVNNLNVMYIVHLNVMYILHLNIMYIVHFNVMYIVHLNVMYILYLKMMYILHLNLTSELTPNCPGLRGTTPRHRKPVPRRPRRPRLGRFSGEHL